VLAKKLVPPLVGPARKDRQARGAGQGRHIRMERLDRRCMRYNLYALQLRNQQSVLNSQVQHQLKSDKPRCWQSRPEYVILEPGEGSRDNLAARILSARLMLVLGCANVPRKLFSFDKFALRSLLAMPVLAEKALRCAMR
jgi:hypothetical protein